VRFPSFGGVITEIDVPDRAGHLYDIVLGLRTLREYETLPGHFGAITGRYANRIGGARFTLGGQSYHLLANNGANTLHAALTRSIVRSGRCQPRPCAKVSPQRSATSVETAIRTFLAH